MVHIRMHIVFFFFCATTIFFFFFLQGKQTPSSVFRSEQASNMSSTLPVIKSYDSGTIYAGNQHIIQSLQFKSTARSNAYIQSVSQRASSIKWQDEYRKSDPTQDIQAQQIFQTPFFQYKPGADEGEVTGNKVRIKQIQLRVYIYQNVPSPDTYNQYPNDVPTFFVHYALVYSCTPYVPGSGNYVKWSDVFQDINPNTELAGSTPFSFKAFNNQDLYTVLIERTTTVGGYNPYTSANPGSLLRHYNRPPFSQFFDDFINLWDVHEHFKGSMNPDPLSQKPIFSTGLKVQLSTQEASTLTLGIDTGSIWIVAAIDRILPNNQTPTQPTMELYTRMAYSDQS